MHDKMTPLPQPTAGHRPAALPAYPGNHSAYQPEPLLPAHTIHRHSRQRFVRLVIAILISVGLFILLFMALHRSDNEQAHRSAEKFVSILQSADANRAYAMGAPAFRAATTEEQLRQMLNQVKPFIAGAQIQEADSYYATSEKGAPRAIVVYTATKGKKVIYIRVVMDKQGGAWKAHSVLTKSEPLQAQPE